MKIGGEDRAAWLQTRHWERFADAVALKRRYVMETVRKMAGRIVPEAEALARGFAKGEAREIVEAVVGVVRKRAKRWKERG